VVFGTAEAPIGAIGPRCAHGASHGCRQRHGVHLAPVGTRIVAELDAASEDKWRQRSEQEGGHVSSA
jgi:hypothetical protein